MFSADQSFLPAAKANLEAQLAMFTTLSHAAIENTEKIIDFNVTTTKTNWAKSTTATKQLLSMQDSQERLSLVATRTRENIEAAISYSRSMADLVTTARNELGKELAAQTVESRRRMSAAVEQMALQAPASAEPGITLMKSALNNLNSGYEQWTNVMRQAAAAMESQLTAAADQISQATEKKPTSQTAKK